MNTAITVTTISVMGTAVFGLFFMQFQNLREDMKKGFETLATKVDNNTAAISALDTKLTGEIKDVEVRLTGEIKDVEVRLTEKFMSCLREHGERLARIETKLDIDPPADTKETPSGGSAAHVYDW